MLLVWGPTVCWGWVRNSGVAQSFTSQNSGLKVGQNEESLGAPASDTTLRNTSVRSSVSGSLTGRVLGH